MVVVFGEAILRSSVADWQYMARAEQRRNLGLKI